MQETTFNMHPFRPCWTRERARTSRFACTSPMQPMYSFQSQGQKVCRVNGCGGPNYLFPHALQVPATFTLKDALTMLCPALADALDEPARSAVSVVLHGIPAPLNAPLAWLVQHMAYPDQFLHVALPNPPPAALCRAPAMVALQRMAAGGSSSSGAASSSTTREGGASPPPEPPSL